MVSKLKIGAHKFDVEKLPDRYMPDTCGEVKVDTLRIFVRDDLPVSMELETLVHEVLHAIRILSGTNLSDDSEEERVVQSVGHLLYQFLKDNPELLQEIITSNEIHII